MSDEEIFNKILNVDYYTPIRIITRHNNYVAVLVSRKDRYRVMFYEELQSGDIMYILNYHVNDIPCVDTPKFILENVPEIIDIFKIVMSSDTIKNIRLIY